MQLRIRGPMLIEVTETFAAGNEIVPGGRSDRCSGHKKFRRPYYHTPTLSTRDPVFEFLCHQFAILVWLLLSNTML